VTSIDGANPGFTQLTLNATTQSVTDLKMTFLSIEKTYGWRQPFKPIQAWPWNTLDYQAVVNLTEVTPQGIEQMMLRLKGDATLTKRYLAMKIGYNPDDADEFKKAMEVYEEFGTITEDT
jgi:hypothetical protein